MAKIIIELIKVLSAIVVAVIGASWFTPDLLRLDILVPTKEAQIIDDFVYVQFQGYSDSELGTAIETVREEENGDEVKIFDRANYIEHVSLKRTKANYEIRLASTGAWPEIKAISPQLNSPERKEDGTLRVLAANLVLEQSPEYHFSGKTPNPKMVYVFRNGFQGRNSYGGKNVKYATAHLTFVYDFSGLQGWEQLFSAAPKACLFDAKDKAMKDLELKWNNGVAIVEAYDAEPSDKVRIYWTWKRPGTKLQPFERLTCKHATS